MSLSISTSLIIWSGHSCLRFFKKKREWELSVIGCTVSLDLSVTLDFVSSSLGLLADAYVCINSILYQTMSLAFQPKH